MCGCAYLNGWVGIIGVQLLALIGMLFSVAAMGDCSFVELDERLFFPPDLDENLPLKVTQTQYVGFLTWKMLDGSCYFYYNGSDRVGQINQLFDILGRDWEMARVVAMLSTCLSFVYFCYLLSFTCSSQTRGVRYFNTVFLSVVLTALQGIPFLSFRSSFCEEYGCTFSRSAGFCAASMGCFFLSGLCFFCTTDYPGPNSNKRMPKLMSVAQVAPEQSQGMQQRMSMESAKYDDAYSEELVMQDYEDEVEEDLLDEQGEEGEEMIEEEIVEDEEEVVEEYDSDASEVLDDTQTAVKATASTDDDSDDDESDAFVKNPDLEAGEDVELYTEVTEEEVRTVETITHTDGSQTVTETHEEVVDENRAAV